MAGAQRSKLTKDLSFGKLLVPNNDNIASTHRFWNARLKGGRKMIEVQQISKVTAQRTYNTQEGIGSSDRKISNGLEIMWKCVSRSDKTLGRLVPSNAVRKDESNTPQSAQQGRSQRLPRPSEAFEMMGNGSDEILKAKEIPSASAH